MNLTEAQNHRPHPKNERAALGTSFSDANATSTLESMHLEQCSNCHIPDADVVTKMETHHVSLKSLSSTISSKSLGNTLYFRHKNNQKRALPGCEKLVPTFVAPLACLALHRGGFVSN